MELRIELESGAQRLELFGPADSHLRLLKNAMGVHITARDGNISLTGEASAVHHTAEIIDQMQRHLLKYKKLTENDVTDLLAAQPESRSAAHRGDTIEVYSNKKIIEPFTAGQLRYVETMLKNDVTFCIGPAGTGKTYLAVAIAVSMLKKKQIRKIVLARPAVEAGERLGFLPGDLQAKVNPYLRPLFDSLEDMMDYSQMRKFIEMDIIEIIPLAFMRGRTLNEATVICDESQNTTTSQMLMFLTRLGRGSKMMITGDITQTDLEKGQPSGMVDAVKKLRHIKGIGVVELERMDIVRHKLVHKIVEAYDQNLKHSEAPKD